MSTISLRRLLSKLAVIALSTAPAAASAALTAPDARACVDDDCELDADASIDHGQVDRRDAALMLGRTLAQALVELRPLEATHLAATWAISDDPLRREAVAHALEWPFRLVGDALAIDHLASDPDPAIRAAAARAAWSRRARIGDFGVLARLADDPDPEVRAVVERAG